MRGASRRSPLRSPAPAPVPPLFRRLDWLALAITFGVVWTVYLLTLAPELTLEDSGELVTGAFYAGIPHPPGYPVWTIYSWLWTHAAADRQHGLAGVGGAGVLGRDGLRFARADGFPGQQHVHGGDRRTQGDDRQMGKRHLLHLGAVRGPAAGPGRVHVAGVGGRQPHRRHQRAVVSGGAGLPAAVDLRAAPVALRLLGGVSVRGLHHAASKPDRRGLGIEVALAAGNPKLGRDAFLGNFIIYLADCLMVAVTGDHMFHNIGAKPGLLFLFNAIGIGSLVASMWLAVRTKGLGTCWKPILIMAGLWMLGVSFYLYMAVSGMTNPPMQWGYPRTVEGFFHAISRGQYEQPNPTNLITEPGRFLSQMGMLVEGAADEFTWVYLFIALVPFVFFFKMQKRERAWLISLTGHVSLPGRPVDRPAQSLARQGLGRPLQGLHVLVPHDRRVPDRLRLGPDRRFHGDALPEIPAVGPGGGHGRESCWRCFASGMRRASITLVRPG